MNGQSKFCIYPQWSINQPFKRKEILIYTTMCINPEDITPSEISQTQKDRYCMNPLYITYLEQSNSQKQSRMVVAGF